MVLSVSSQVEQGNRANPVGPLLIRYVERMMVWTDERQRRRAFRVSEVAAFTGVLLVLASYFCELAPYMVFHSRERDGYPALRGAASLLLVMSIVAFALWAESTIGLRVHRDTLRRSVGWAFGLLAVITMVAAYLVIPFYIIGFVTVDWMVW